MLNDSIKKWVYDCSMVISFFYKKHGSYLFPNIILIFSTLLKIFMLNSVDLMEGYKAAGSVTDEQWKIQQRSLFAQCEAVADMKFTYVVSCQQYGNDKRAALSNAQDILQLMRK